MIRLNQNNSSDYHAKKETIRRRVMKDLKKELVVKKPEVKRRGKDS